MTALTEYDRLESGGLWRESPQAQRRDVVVSLGDATLILSSSTDQALAHWSLPAIERLNPGQRPALFSTGPDAPETLEIEDDQMIDAIEKVRKVLEKRKAKPGRLRLYIVLAALAGFGALAYFKLPDTLQSYTLNVIPEVKRSEIGTRLLNRFQRANGTSCSTSLGTRALSQLHNRLFDGRKGRLLVFETGVQTIDHVPGGTVLISNDLVEKFDEPGVVAGYILSEHLRRLDRDPLKPILDYAGFIATFRLYTTGSLPEATLDGYAKMLANGPREMPSTDRLLTAFEAASVSSSAFAYALDPTGELTLPLIEADPFPNGTPRPVLPDGAWISLQGICAD